MNDEAFIDDDLEHFGNKIIATADFETDPFKEYRPIKPFAAGFYDGSSYWEWFGDDGDCIEPFVNFIDSIPEKEKERYIVYMHNGGGFDFNYLVDEMDAEIMVINNDIIKMKIRGVEFRDSLLILPVPLSSYAKDKVDYDMFEKEQRWQPENFKTIKDYLKNDCIYLHEFVTRFIKRFGLHLTIASASFNQLKASGYKIIKGNTKNDDEFRCFYYGGRTQVKQGGEHLGDVFYMDINSAYSKAMLDFHPFGTNNTTLYSLPDDGMYFAKIKAISRGALPFKDADTGYLTFPDDDIEREYSVTSWEIDAGLETETLDITDIIEVRQHHKTRPFDEFVNKFYPEKQAAKEAGDKVAETFAKIILNASYGKWALNPRAYKTHCITPQGALPDELVRWYLHYGVDNIKALFEAIMFDPEFDDEENGDFKRDQRLNVATWEVIRDVSNGKDGFTIWARANPSYRFYNVATAASITGHVRATLFRAMCECKDVIYVDTDSIMCREFSGRISNDLGDWKQECIFDHLYVGGKKLYAGHIKNAGWMLESDYNDLKEGEQRRHIKENWKKASKGSQLSPYQIKRIVTDGAVEKWVSKSPNFSLRYGMRFIDRKIKMTV